MPVYHFDFRCHDTVQKDESGHELPSDEAALEEAVMAAKEVVISRIRAGQPLGQDRYEVRRGTSEPIHIVSLRSVLRFD